MMKFQNQAIAQMAEARHEYNLGILSMLGKEQMAVEHAALRRLAAVLCEQRDAANDNGDDFAALLAPLNGQAAVIQAEIDTVSQRAAAAWAPIQALINEAQKALEMADPMGMSQSV